MRPSGYQLDIAKSYSQVQTYSSSCLTLEMSISIRIRFASSQTWLPHNPECGKKLHTWLNAGSLVILIFHFINVHSFSQAVTLPPRLLVIHSRIWAVVLLGSVKLVCCRLLFAQRTACPAKMGDSCTLVSMKKEHASWTTVPWLELVIPSYTVCKKSCTLWSATQERETKCHYQVEAKGSRDRTSAQLLSAPLLIARSSES